MRFFSIKILEHYIILKTSNINHNLGINNQLTTQLSSHSHPDLLTSQEHPKIDLMLKPPLPTKPKPVRVQLPIASSGTVEPNKNIMMPVTNSWELISTSINQDTTAVPTTQTVITDDSSIIILISDKEQSVPCSDNENYFEDSSNLVKTQDETNDFEDAMSSTDTTELNLPVNGQNNASQQHEQQYSSCCADSDENEPETASKIPCRYGERCYMKNVQHLEKYSHPQRSQVPADTLEKSMKSSSFSKQPCLYGEKCYRKNPEHLAKYYHSQDEVSKSLYSTDLAQKIAKAEADIEAKRQQMEEDIRRQKVEIETQRQKVKEELRQEATELELRQEEMDAEIKRWEAERKVERLKAEWNLQRERAEIARERKKAEDEMHDRIKNTEEKREKIQLHLELVEKQFRESMAGAENDKKSLEESIEKLRKEKMKIAEYHQQLEKALADEINERERRDIEKQRILTIKRDIPSYWGINALDESYREIKINPGSPEFTIIRDLLNDTIETHGDKYGTIYGKDPTEFLVTSVTRIHNKMLWHEYCFKKVIIDTTKVLLVYFIALFISGKYY